MKPRFTMFYTDHTFVDDGKDVEVVFKVPEVWAYAPKDGMQGVIVHRADGKLVPHDGRDIYVVLPSGEPMATNDLGPLLRSIGIAKYGLQIPTVEFDEVRERMRAYRRNHEEGI
jgi:hypothetical protein